MLTEEQDQFLIGAILGDSNVERNNINCRIRFEHGIKQLEYLRFKHKQLNPFSLKVTEFTIPNKNRDGFYFKCRFNTRTLPLFNKYHEIFYPSGIKIIPPNINELLTSQLALLIWYLDDGHLRDYKCFRFSTDGFSYDDIIRLQITLKKNFGFETAINIADSTKNTYTLNINSEGGQADQFNNYMRPFVEKEIPSMLYKFF